VPFEQSRRFEEALQKAGVAVKSLAVEKAGHAFGSGWADAAAEFLQRKLQPQPAAAQATGRC
jgi:dipeptidyl aminopeptidase/acylaminoacyl peptidase